LKGPSRYKVRKKEKSSNNYKGGTGIAGKGNDGREEKQIVFRKGTI